MQPQDSPTGKVATEEHLSSSVEATWSTHGTISLTKDKLVFPVFPPVPGIYRFSLTPSRGPLTVYVGETTNLNTRMSHYRNPGPTQLTNQRINARLKETVTNSGSVLVDAITAATVSGRRLDLASRAARRLVESLALVELGHVGRPLENL